MIVARSAPKFAGFAGTMGVVMSMIISLVVGIIIINQLFLSAPEPPKYLDNEGTINPAWESWQRVQTLGWAAIGLLSVSMIVASAVVIMQMVRSGTRL